MNILICEDEKTLAKVLQEKFEKEKYTVNVASSGDDVLPLIKKTNPDLILLDIILPKINGLDILKLIKKEDEMKDIPVIMLSNLDDDEKLKQAILLGAVDYIVKSQHPIKEVIEKVKEYFLKAK